MRSVKYRRVSTESLRVGSVLKSPIPDPQNDNLILVGNGVKITEELKAKLSRRGISDLMVSARDFAIQNAFQPQGRSTKPSPAPIYITSDLQNDVSRHLDSLLTSPDSLAIAQNVEPLSAKIVRPQNCSYAEGLQFQWAEDLDEEIESLDAVNAESLLRESDASPLLHTCRKILQDLAEDADAAVCLGGTPTDSDYPTRHSVHCATIAMAMGLDTGLSEAQLIDLGMGCLVHDIGMQQVGLSIFETPKAISPRQLNRLSDHSVHAVEIADRFGKAVSETAKLIAYQMHERLDGSGYPRGLTAAQIHPYAKIAMIADTFVALLSPRPHRKGLQGHYAILALLDDVKARKIDPTIVRHLLTVTSMFPIGSYVRLSNEYVGRVVRAGTPEFGKPTVEMWSPDKLGHRPTIANLVHESSLEITAPIVGLDAIPSAA